MAAEQGFADAQVNLGFMYHNGRGVPQDYAEAVKWFPPLLVTIKQIEINYKLPMPPGNH